MTTQIDADPPESGHTGDAPPKVPSTKEFVWRQVSALQGGYVRDHPTSRSRASLAQLRRGVGKKIGELPELLEYVVPPSSATGRAYRQSGPTAAEEAAYTAITLYAAHQQSQSARMHRPGTSFATAIGGLRFADGEEDQGVIRRFQALSTATDYTELAQHARGLIQLLRRKERGFDYGRFAEDLEALQNPRRADWVRLQWGRDFYGVRQPSEPTSTDSTSTTSNPQEQ